MPPRRAPQKAKAEAPEISEGEADLSLSQESNNSEGQKEQFVELIKKHYAATVQKDTVRKEKKLLESARKELDVRAEYAPVLNDSVKEVESVYTTFLLDYASWEDKIQATWAYIQEKQEALEKIVERRKKKDQETLCLEGLAVFPGISKMKASRKAFNATIEHLNALVYEEDSEDPQD